LRFGDDDCPLTATASSELPVVYTSSAPAIATIENGSLHILGAGSVTITASQPGNENWLAAPAVPKALVIAKRNQTIDFPAFSVHAMGDADFAPGAMASSGLPITYVSATPTVATIVNGKIHIVGKGTAVITASQAGNTSWNAATPVKQTLTVEKGQQGIRFPELPVKHYGDPDFAPGATASSGLAITYVSSNLQVATIVLGKIHIIGIGRTTIIASQGGNANWDPAGNASQELTVEKGIPVITWANPLPIIYGAALSAIQLNAKANVPGSFVYSPVLGTKLPAGDHTLMAAFTPTDAVRYTTAEKSVPLTVKKAAAVITITGLAQTYNGQPHPVTVTTVPPGLHVSISYAGSPDAPVNASSYPVTVTVVENNYTGSKTGTLAVAKAKQTITFAALPAMRIGDDDYPLTATASSGLTVNYASSAPLVATIVAGAIHVAGTGTATITATQPGNGNWLAAVAVAKPLVVQTEDQDIRAFYAEMKRLLETHDEAGFLALFDPDYIHQGYNLDEQFSDPDFLDTFKTFTFTISKITVTGIDAKVAGTCTILSNNGDPVQTWAEPDTLDNSPGLGWLRKTPDGWRIIGDQIRARVQAETGHETTPGNDYYFFRMRLESSFAVTSITVSGPKIDTTELLPDAGWGGFTAFVGDFTSTTRPAVGSVYTFAIHFADGTEATYQDTLKSWVPVGPVISVTPNAAAGTATIKWTNVSASVPKADHYWVWVDGSDVDWQSSDELPISQTSILFDDDGTANGSLISGQTYMVQVFIFDGYDNYACRTYEFTMP
jgi:hypothetical protein